MLLRQFVNYKAVPKTVTMIIQTRVRSVLGDRLYAIENKANKDTLCLSVLFALNRHHDHGNTYKREHSTGACL